jgi:hypothetical protein
MRMRSLAAIPLWMVLSAGLFLTGRELVRLHAEAMAAPPPNLSSVEPRYYKDHRTELCFAGSSHVPCTDKVLELIEHQRSAR